MRTWRSDFSSIAENLACDEALLAHAEATGESWLRTWLPTANAVVLGYANRCETEVNTAFCRENNVEIHRRISGGGTVVLLPGSLCFALVIPIVSGTPFAQIPTTNRFIMETHRDAIERLTHQTVTVEGVTDLSIGGKKFSGNSQKRSRRALLFHGTFLCGSDLDLINACLHHPTSEPDWRQGRSHSQFITNLETNCEAVENALHQCWSAITAPPPPEIAGQSADLSDQKYQRDHWRNLR